MPEILITFQLPFMPSSGKHVLHWKGPSLTAALLFPLSQTLEKLAKILSTGCQPRLYYYVLLAPSEKCGLKKDGKPSNKRGFITMYRCKGFSVCQKNTFHIHSISCGLY